MKVSEINQVIIQTIEEYSLVSSGDRVLLMCSGGPDSTFLLFFFKEFANFFNVDFGVFHLDHKIRKDSFKEKKILEKYCEELKVNLYSFEEDIISIAKSNRMNIEECARNVRYDLAYDTAKRYGYNKLATAHNFDDFLSSFFMNLLKKVHYINLFNMKPLMIWRDIPVVRPLIFIPKRYISKILDQKKIKYVVDYTNYDQKLLRNRIQQNITKYVVDYLVNFDLRKIFGNLIKFTYSYSDNVKKCLKIFYLGQKVYLLKKDGEIGDFFLIESLYFNIKNLLAKSVKYQTISKIIDNKKINVRKNWKLEKDGEVFYLYFSPYRFEEIFIEIYSLKEHTEHIVFMDDLKLNFKILGVYNFGEDDKKFFTKESIRRIREDKNYCLAIFADYVKIRKRKNGDFFYPYGMKGRKQKLKKFFINMKMKEFQKERCIIFEDSKGIALVWCFLNNIKRGRDMEAIKNFVNPEKKESKWFIVEITANRILYE